MVWHRQTKTDDVFRCHKHLHKPRCNASVKCRIGEDKLHVIRGHAEFCLGLSLRDNCTTIVDLTDEYRLFVVEMARTNVGVSAKAIAIEAALHFRKKCNAGAYCKGHSEKLDFRHPSQSTVHFCDMNDILYTLLTSGLLSAHEFSVQFPCFDAPECPCFILGRRLCSSNYT